MPVPQGASLEGFPQAAEGSRRRRAPLRRAERFIAFMDAVRASLTARRSPWPAAGRLNGASMTRSPSALPGALVGRVGPGLRCEPARSDDARHRCRLRPLRPAGHRWLGYKVAVAAMRTVWCDNGYLTRARAGGNARGASQRRVRSLTGAKCPTLPAMVARIAAAKPCGSGVCGGRGARDWVSPGVAKRTREPVTAPIPSRHGVALQPAAGLASPA